MNFSEKLRTLRIQNGFSTASLAEHLKINENSIIKWENGDETPDIKTIIILSELFKTSIDSLLREDTAIPDTESCEHSPDLPSFSDDKQKVIFCSKCGKQNPIGSLFCGYCGNPFTVMPSEVFANTDMPESDIDLAYYKANLQMQRQSIIMHQRELEESKVLAEQQARQYELQKEQYDKILKCPRCGSTSLSSNKKGYGIGKGLVGAALVGPLGLIAGNIGSGDVKITCLNCGHKFKPKNKWFLF